MRGSPSSAIDAPGTEVKLMRALGPSLRESGDRVGEVAAKGHV
jgi:hypothetical protein